MKSLVLIVGFWFFFGENVGSEDFSQCKGIYNRYFSQFQRIFRNTALAEWFHRILRETSPEKCVKIIYFCRNYLHLLTLFSGINSRESVLARTAPSRWSLSPFCQQKSSSAPISLYKQNFFISVEFQDPSGLNLPFFSRFYFAYPFTTSLLEHAASCRNWAPLRTVWKCQARQKINIAFPLRVSPAIIKSKHLKL